MTQKQIEQTRVIAEWDGWKIDRSLAYRGMGAIPTHSLNYLTDLNVLHPVAMDVLDVIRKSRKEHYQYYVSLILNDCCERPINGEYIDLFNAVYEGIVFLNENKN
jgi:hypothetical protein